MTHTVRVQLSEDGLHWLLHGGAPGGNDDVHREVSSWPGWRRMPSNAANKVGIGCSTYTARVWASTTLPLVKTTWRVEWSVVAPLDGIIRSLEMAHESLNRTDFTPVAISGRVPRIHQLQGCHALRYMGFRALLGDDMGLGKTFTALQAFCMWALMGNRRMLVICPKSVKLNWPKEIAMELGDPVKCPVYVIDGTQKQRNECFAAIRHHGENTPDKLGVVVINYDQLRLLSPTHTEILRAWVDGQALICDEAHYLKSWDSDRTKFVRTWFAPPEGGAEFRLLLGGTPVTNQVDDLFAQVEIVRPGTWTSKSDFVNRYCVVVPLTVPGRKRVLHVVRGAKNQQELSGIMSTLMVMRKKEEVGGLPERIYTKPELELDGPLLQVYRAMKELALLELEKLASELEPTATIWHPAARSGVEAAMRCEQIAQGFVGGVPDEVLARLAPLLTKLVARVPDRPGELIFPSAPKLVWLLEQLERLRDDQPAVVACRFNAPLLWLQSQLPKSTILYGAIDAVERQARIEAFQRGEFRTMLLQIKVAEGPNLHRSSDMFFLGRDWSPARNEQTEGRVHRIGSLGTVNVQIPIVVNTIERMIDRRLAVKASDANQALARVTVKELMEAL